MKQLLLEILSPAAPTLDNFVTGVNAELVGWLQHCPCSPPGERFAYLWGPSGSGKTHLLRGVVGRALERGLAAVYVTAAESDETLVGLEGFDVVAVDGVDCASPAGQAGLFHLYNRMREREGTLLVTGASAPLYLDLREDLATRLGWGLVFQVHLLDDAAKARALIRHAQTRGFRLTHEAADYLLRHARRDLPSLLQILEALDRHSLETKRPVSLALIREIVQPDLPPPLSGGNTP